MRPLLLSLVLVLATSASATAAGGPASGLPAGGDGVTTPGSAVRYVTVSSRHQTFVLAISRATGRLERWHGLPRVVDVSAVSADGAGTGLSADGRTLVLAPPRIRFPVRHSRFEILDARSLRARAPVVLRGDFTLDAVSPDGRLLFLVQYTSPNDVTKYLVRAYDVATRKLRPKPVVDPAEADEPMRGMPLARSQSPDGRWAYTLYDGGGTHPFVHALDTARATAKCIDVDQLAGRDDLWNMHLRTDLSGAVVVFGDHGPVATIDPRTFVVRDAAAPVRHERRPAVQDDGSPVVAFVIAAAFALLLAAGLVARRGRPRIGSA